MKKYENECVGCAPEMRCLGSTCPNRNVLHLYCDECGEETTLYIYDEEEMCIECITARLEMVEQFNRR